MEYMHSKSPFSIAVELDNIMLGEAALDGFPQKVNKDSNATEASREAVSAADFFLRSVCDAMEARLSIAMDLARRGEIELTAADLLKACQWAEAQPHDLADKALGRVIEIAELFGAKGQQSRTEQRSVAARRKPKSGAKAKAA